GAGVGVGPSVAAVGGPKDEVRARSEAPAAFVHAGDVHVARGQVTGDLDVADERGAAGQLSRVGPSGTVVSGIADEESASPDIEVVPGNVHMPIEWAGRVVVCPARLSVVVVVGVNAVMGPAIRVPGSGGVVPAEALTATAHVKPDSVPSAGWAVVQNNGVALGIGEGALTGGGGEADEGVGAVSGDRCTGDVDGAGVAAS